MEIKPEDGRFFSELLSDAKIIFEQSPVYLKQSAQGKSWNYAVCATPITKEKGILFGINWGGEDGYSAQSVMPDELRIVKFPFIQRSKKYFRKYLNLDVAPPNFNYTNLCFFRTPKEKDLSNGDYKLSLPLFEKYVRYINPPWMLSLGATNFKKLKDLGLLSNIQTYFDEQNKFRGYSAQLWQWKVYFVPHPNAHLTSHARETIWAKVAMDMKISTPN